jgi:Rod binding domain-containing protein
MSGHVSALPQVPDSALPRAVREGSAADRDTYKAALGFERMFVEQLLKSATAGRPLAEGPQGDAVEGALADAMVLNGGFGLAAQLAPQLRRGS